ncbi:hypothetical protein JTE90_012206, partial [Oedothorax gibbosus]
MNRACGRIPAASPSAGTPYALFTEE